MEGKRILLYGATGGIGAALARRLVAGGATVYLVARDTEKLSRLGDELSMPWQSVDVLEKDAFTSVAEQGPDLLDGLVYAIGSINLKSLKRLRADDFMGDFRLNAMGAACAVQSALPALQRSKDASVVLMSSIAAAYGFAMHASMGMAKGAVSGLTVSLAAELAPHIRVNAVAPSLTRTPLAASILSSDAMSSALAKQHPLQRLGDPADVAALAYWLLGPESAWMTGQIIGLDGGRSALSCKG